MSDNSGSMFVLYYVEAVVFRNNSLEPLHWISMRLNSLIPATSDDPNWYIGWMNQLLDDVKNAVVEDFQEACGIEFNEELHKVSLSINKLI